MSDVLYKIYRALKPNGVLYASFKYGDKDNMGMVQSMSRVGCCMDNGPMEEFWGILKSEMYYLNRFDDYEV
ncbi:MULTISPECIES: hypothetical protein [unclassified Caldicellulosiruptor]|uniref:hypothetical protein n=1 Tax=unclassified Caldicellulosiruptor TaxID=2622462 RepID=UPI001ED9BE4A|nr:MULTISPECIES: hypothetical protein [unclassified Caldicellulosiruptor]